MYHALHGSGTDPQGVGNLLKVAGDSGERERGSLYLLGFFCTSGAFQGHHLLSKRYNTISVAWACFSVCLCSCGFILGLRCARPAGVERAGR